MYTFLIYFVVLFVDHIKNPSAVQVSGEIIIALIWATGTTKLVIIANRGNSDNHYRPNRVPPIWGQNIDLSYCTIIYHTLYCAI